MGGLPAWSHEVAPAMGESMLLQVAPTQFIQAVRASFDPITNLSVVVERKIPLGDGKGSIAMMSRVLWARENRLLVRTLKPTERCVLIDGTNVYIRAPETKEFAIQKITEQSPEQRAQLQAVPGSPLEFLVGLDATSAVELPAIQGVARRLSFSSRDPKAPAQKTVVSLDSEGRILTLAVFADAAMSKGMGTLRFSGYTEVLPNVWLVKRIESQFEKSGETDDAANKIQNHTQFSRFSVNQPLAADAFDPTIHF